MSARVNHPNEMQSHEISEDVSVEGNLERLAEIATKPNWNNETEDDGEWQIILVLEHHNLISLQVVHLYATAEFCHVGMFLAHQPTDMREKEAAL